MNSVVLYTITGYQHNLISDLVTMNVWEVFIQVHWGSWGKSPCFRAQPPSIATQPTCHACTQPGDWVINDQGSWCHWQLLVTLHKSHHPCHISTSLGTFGWMLLACNTGNMLKPDVWVPASSSASSCSSRFFFPLLFYFCVGLCTK